MMATPMASNNPAGSQANSQARPTREARAELLASVFGQLLAWRAERLAGAKANVAVDPPAGPGGVRDDAVMASPPYAVEQ